MLKKLLYIFMIALVSCGEQVVENNTFSKHTAKSDEDQRNNEVFIRKKSINSANICRQSILIIKDTHITLDSIFSNSKLTVSTTVWNGGSQDLKIQDVLVSSPYIVPLTKEIVLLPNERKDLEFEIDPKLLSGYYSFECILLNNSIDTEKKLCIKGHFNAK